MAPVTKLAAGLLLLTTAAHAFPPRAKAPFNQRRLQEADTVSNDGLLYAHHFEHTDEYGREVMVRYQAEVRADLKWHDINLEEQLVNVIAMGGGAMLLRFTSKAEAEQFRQRAHIGDVIRGHYIDAPKGGSTSRSGSSSSEPNPFHAKITTMQPSAADDTAVEITTTVPPLTELFKNAELTASVKLAPEDYKHAFAAQQEAEVAAAAAAAAASGKGLRGQSRDDNEQQVQEDEIVESSNDSSNGNAGARTSRRLDATSLVNIGLSDMKKLGDQAFALGKGSTVTSATAYMNKGDLDIVGSGGLQELVNAPTCKYQLHDQFQSKQYFTGTCKSCFATSYVTMSLSLSIVDFEMTAISLMLNGPMDFNFNMDYMPITAATTRSWSKTLMTYFTQAVPIQMAMATISMACEVPITVGLDMDGKSGTKAAFTMYHSVMTKISAGFSWKTGEDRKLINSIEVTHNGHSLLPLELPTAPVSVRFWLMPLVTMKIMLGSTTENSLAVGLGGPIIGVKAYVETLVEKAPTTIPASPTNDYSVTQSVGVEGVIGLDLHFQVGEYEDQLVDAGFADLVAVYSRKYPLDNSVFSTQKTTGRRLEAVDSTQLQTAEDMPISDIRISKRQSLEVLPNGDSTSTKQQQQQQQRKLAAATLVPAFARSGSVYQGDMDILKEPEEYPECVAAAGQVFPAYMSMFAQVTGFTLNTAATPEDGWTFKLVIGASYGEQDFDNTAYAAYNQALYLMSFRPLTLPENDPTCQFVLTVGANGTDPAVPLEIQDSPPVTYVGTTSTTATALPALYGQFCDSTGQTMVITDANGCYSVILSNEYLDPNEENNRRNNQQNGAARKLR
jgi:hypothetical protein